MTAVVRGDALHIPLQDKSVNLIITSPPYFALRSYRDDGEHYSGQIGSEPTPQAFLEALWAVTKECWRVLADDGVMFVNLGDKRAGSNGQAGGPASSSTLVGTHHRERGIDKGYVPKSRIRPKSKMALPHRYFIGCMDGLADPDGIGWIARQDIVWSKPNGLPESVTDRVRDSHEYWFMLTKSERYFAAVDEVRESYAPGTAERYAAGFTQIETSAGGHTKNGVLRADNGGPSSTNPLGKLPGSVWTIPSEPLVVPEWLGVDHFAAFPQEWPRRLILGWSPSGICTACGGEGVHRLRDEERTPGLRPSGQDDSLFPDFAGAGSSAGCSSSRDGEMRCEVRGLPHEATLGGGDEDTAERVEASAVLLRDGVGSAGPVPEALHEVEAPRRSASRAASGDCACRGKVTTRPSVILDPFGGTGTTAMVARALGRTGISLDLSSDYCRLAQWRIFESGHAAKARERTNRENQGTLL